MTRPASPLLLNLLADRAGVPAALYCPADCGDAPPPTLAELTTRLPCFYSDQLAPEASAPLAALGWQPLLPLRLQRATQADHLHPGAAADWFDGDWWQQAPASVANGQAASRALALQLVQLVSDDADTHAIEALLRRDPTLSYHLLKLVNSTGMGAGRKVTSFGQAILILGRAQLRRWLNLMLFAAREGELRSPMLLARVSLRARSMELLARGAGLAKPVQEQAFMVGMFSLLGVLFGMPLPQLLAPLKIGDSMQGALLQRSGELGALLALVEAAEQADADTIANQLAALPLAPADFNSIVAEAYLWMLNVTREAAAHA